MKHKKVFFCIMSLLLFMSSLVTSPVFADVIPADKYALSYEKIGTVKERVTFPDYDIDEEFEIILVPLGSTITFTPSENMAAYATGLDKEDGVFLDTYDAVPWVIDGQMELTTAIDGGKTAVAALKNYQYYMFRIADENMNVIRIFFKTVDPNSTENPGSVTEDNKDVPDNWANEEVQKAISLELVPEELQNHYKDSITRSDFCKLVINMIEINTGKSAEALISDKGINKSDNPFTDTSETFIINANALGIVNGKGNGIFDPNGSITRQEAAVMLTNAAKALDQEITSSDVAYSDNASIGNWAKSSVNFVSSIKVMNGTGNNNFSPKDTYSKQQAFMTILRLFESIK